MNDRLIQQAIDQLEDALTTLAALGSAPLVRRQAFEAHLKTQIVAAQTRLRLARGGADARKAATVDIKAPRVTFASGRTVIV